MRAILFINTLLLVLVMTGSGSLPGQGQTGAVATAGPTISARQDSPLSISVRAATGATILFKTENGKEASVPSENDQKIPYLILNRNGVPTPNFERTLHLTMENLVVPPSGVYVELEIETQHYVPDLDRRDSDKIRVWEEKRFLPYPGSQQPQTVDFTILFQRTFEYQEQTIRTPTDYFRYRLTLWDPQGNILKVINHRYAFLMENQWRVPLPKVLEAVPGAAPNELVIYYIDMLPFQTNFRDRNTRIPRTEIERFIQTELVPAMVEAFERQTNLWGMPWYEEWSSRRVEDDPKTLSVALTERGTWFHGSSPSLGNSLISIRVDGSFIEYSNLTDGIMSVFHHELFHNQQRNISVHFGSQGNISGRESAWELFSEGTAVLASLVGQPAVQMTSSTMSRSYLELANAFIGAEGFFSGSLNLSYTEIPYHTAMYWRYLYEQCGGIHDGKEDPATGMQVIRNVLETLYSGKIVDINTSTSVVEVLPQILDEALYKTQTCPFRSFDESLVGFTRAIYLLRDVEGRCAGSNPSSQCGFFDPHKLYSVPDEEIYIITDKGKTNIDGSIRSSFGVDLIKISPSSSLNGKSITILFTGTSNLQYTYNIELWAQEGNAAKSGKLIVSKQIRPGSLVEIGKLSLHQVQALDLVITRMDIYENESQPGQYTVQVILE